MNTVTLIEQLISEAEAAETVQNFYPLSRLTLFGLIIDEQLEYAREQLTLLQQAKAMPHLLNRDKAVAHIMKTYVRSTEMDQCYQRQLSFWQTLRPSKKQRQEITRLVRQIARFKQCRSSLLAMAQEFKGNGLEPYATQLCHI